MVMTMVMMMVMMMMMMISGRRIHPSGVKMVLTVVSMVLTVPVALSRLS